MMRWIAAAAGALIFLSVAAVADERRYTTDAEAERWAGVGLLTHASGGSCTGVLIRPDTVLTAAHCVADADRKTVQDAKAMAFQVGRRDGQYIDRVQAKKITVHHGYFSASERYDKRRIRVDLARVQLMRPMRGVPVYRVGNTPSAGADLTLVSFSLGRMSRLSIQKGCRIEGRETEFLLLDCMSDPGASGSPYFQITPGGTVRVVGVNSGTRSRASGKQALALAFDHVRDFIGSSGGVTVPVANASKVEIDDDDEPIAPPRTTRLPGGSTPGEGLSRFKN